MSISVLALTILNIFLGLGIAILWIRQTRPPKEDPRLSRGLQLLQSKIVVLEDLSDRTEAQVKQLTQILDERARSLQTKMLQAQETILKIEQSMHKSLDVAEIFQDKIPHEEIIERNQQTKYVQAAQMAYEGRTVEEILGQVDLPRNEVELIAKVNRDQLTFNPEFLPEWAKRAPSQAAAPEHTAYQPQMPANSTMETRTIDKAFNQQPVDLSSLQRIEEDFKRSVREAEEFERQETERIRMSEERARQMREQASQMTQNFLNSTGEMLKSSGEAIRYGATEAAKATGQAATAAAKATSHAARVSADVAKTAAQSAANHAGPVIRKVQFPKIFIDK